MVQSILGSWNSPWHCVCKSSVWQRHLRKSCVWQSCVWKSCVCHKVVCVCVIKCDKLVCNKVVCVREIVWQSCVCVRVVCVCDKLCVKELCVCHKVVCAIKLCVKARRRRRRRVTEYRTKNKNPTQRCEEKLTFLSYLRSSLDCGGMDCIYLLPRPRFTTTITQSTLYRAIWSQT